ncbi:MAG: hypothetical protein ACP5IT_09530 [Thermoproteota archaeon]|jgi:hypothetical protein
MSSQFYDKIVKHGTERLAGVRKEVKVSIENPTEGINFKRLFMALNLLLSEKDILDYLDNYQGIHFPISIDDEVSTKTA